VPLKHIFDFCDDYTITGMKHTLTFVHDSFNVSIFHVPGADAGASEVLNGKVLLEKNKLVHAACYAIRYESTTALQDY
jgi:hypothetical protein